MIRQKFNQPFFADICLHKRSTKLDEIDEMVNWKPIVRKIEAVYKNSKTGRPAYPVITMFKILLLQKWYNLSDPAMEEALYDRLSFRKFAGICAEDDVPDYSTIHRFRDKIADIIDSLFNEIIKQIEEHGLMVREGTSIDASLIQAAVNPPKSDDNSKDKDARWGGKGKDKMVFGYKAHISVDQESEIVRKAEMTAANVNNSQCAVSTFGDVLDNCAQTATLEYQYSKDILTDAMVNIKELRADVKRVVTRFSKSKASEDARQKLIELNRLLDSTINKSIQETNYLLSKKAEHLARLTITLFGRTMAGKSTIREAITNGDGGTIGKGAQRTTRDIREYDWNNLRIIDTPGIGAYEGEVDREIALSIVNESDLLLFLVSSDGIQESTFRGMKAIRSQNKPIIFVLNVKRDLTRRVNLDRFLHDPKSLLGETALQGHIDRIKSLAQNELGIQNVIIVPIHAQAAFMATQEKNPELAKRLNELSCLDRLLCILTEEIKYRGPVLRLQTFLDGTSNHFLSLLELMTEQSKLLERSGQYLRDKFGELDTWLDGYIGSVNVRIEREANVFFQSLRSSVSAFVDDNIESSNIGVRWKSMVESLRIDEWISKTNKHLLDEVQSQLEEFKREIDVESELTSSLKVKGPTQYDPWDTKRTLRWTSAGGAAILGFATLIGGANFWNPVGWCAGAVSLLTYGLSWLFSDKEKKLQKQKARETDKLREEINEIEQKVANKVKAWFDENITSNLIRGIRTDTKKTYKSMFTIASLLQRTIDCLQEHVEQLNRRLITKTSQILNTEQIPVAVIIRLARYPGIKTKLLLNQDLPTGRFCSDVGSVLDESIDCIFNADSDELVARSLTPAQIKQSMVTFNDNSSVLVKAPKQEIERAIGKDGHNISLASQLLNIRIEIQSEE